MPHVAFNAPRNRYLVTWKGVDEGLGMASVEYEVFGQYLSQGGQSLAPGNFRMSHLGDDGDPETRVADNDLAYSPSRDEFLVVFSANPGPFVRS